jgi:hypothetical protein
VAFYREHVEADAVHEQVVRISVVGDLLRAAPHPRPRRGVFGIRAHAVVEERLSSYMMASWEAGHTSLREELP